MPAVGRCPCWALSTPCRQEGGVDSAFKAAQRSAGPVHRLYQVKGRRNIRAAERDLSWASFNTGDCFILDLGEVRGRGAAVPSLSPRSFCVVQEVQCVHPGVHPSVGCPYGRQGGSPSVGRLAVLLAVHLLGRLSVCQVSMCP